MKLLLVAIVVLLGGCATRQSESPSAQIQVPRVQLPVVPAEVMPDNGTVVEFWPNGETRSERLYRAGRVQEAYYYASDGTVVFEMSEDAPPLASGGR